jgi:hypothetical protein
MTYFLNMMQLVLHEHTRFGPRMCDFSGPTAKDTNDRRSSLLVRIDADCGEVDPRPAKGDRFYGKPTGLSNDTLVLPILRGVIAVWGD